MVIRIFFMIIKKSRVELCKNIISTTLKKKLLCMQNVHKFVLKIVIIFVITLYLVYFDDVGDLKIFVKLQKNATLIRLVRL